ncbi:MAG: hypothetical protein L7F78_27800, partial [Syntrophales bacterium LBB04]|nr:hypothetical protein [Syntrophales bacterium LBB04]
AGIPAGAEIAHTCINGLGGNGPLDEIIMGIEAFLCAPTGVKTDGFRQVSAMVKECSGPAGAEWYKPFVGPLTSQVEVGIATRQMWDRRNEHGYGRAELLNYEIVGGKAIEVVLGKKSGRYSLMLKSWELGLAEPTEAQAAEMLSQIKKISEDNMGLGTEEEYKGIHAAVMNAKG